MTKREKAQAAFQKFCAAAALLLCGAVVWSFAMQSLFSTGAYTRAGEVLLLADWPLAHGAVFLLLALASVLWARRRAAPRPQSSRLRRLLPYALLLFYGLCLTAFVLLTRLQPKADAAYMVDSALKLREGDLSPLQPGGYIARYPHQGGLLLYLLAGMTVFGTGSMVWFQLFNALYLTATMALLAGLYRRLTGGGFARCLPVLLAFLPAGLYVTLVYGNVPGLCFAVAGLYALVRFMEGWQPGWGVALAAALAVAVTFKSNYLIVLIACLIVLVLQGLFRRPRRVLAAVALVLACQWAASFAVDACLYTRNGVEKTEGTPSLVWVAMGLQKTEGSTEGFYNGYINTAYDGTPETTEQGKANARQSIEASLQGFAADPAGALRFFARKNAAQWNESSFRSLGVNRNHTSETGRALPGPITALLHEGSALYRGYLQYADLYLTQVYLGVLLCFILGRRRLDLTRLLPAIAFFGGVLFHSVWEGNSEYVWPYVLLLIPYAVQGFELLGQGLWQLTQRPARQWAAQLKKSGAVRWAGAACLGFAAVGLLGCYGTATQAELEENTALWRQDQQAAQPLLADGEYYLQCDAGYLSATQTQPDAALTLTDTPENALRLHVYYSHYSWTASDSFYMMTTAGESVWPVGVGGEELPQAAILSGWVDEKNTRQQWKLKKAGEDSFFIVSENGESYPEDDLTLTVQDGAPALLPDAQTEWRLILAE